MALVGLEERFRNFSVLGSGDFLYEAGFVIIFTYSNIFTFRAIIALGNENFKDLKSLGKEYKRIKSVKTKYRYDLLHEIRNSMTVVKNFSNKIEPYYLEIGEKEDDLLPQHIFLDSTIQHLISAVARMDEKKLKKGAKAREYINPFREVRKIIKNSKSTMRDKVNDQYKDRYVEVLFRQGMDASHHFIGIIFYIIHIVLSADCRFNLFMNFNKKDKVLNLVISTIGDRSNSVSRIAKTLFDYGKLNWAKLNLEIFTYLENEFHMHIPVESYRLAQPTTTLPERTDDYVAKKFFASSRFRKRGYILTRVGGGYEKASAIRDLQYLLRKEDIRVLIVEDNILVQKAAAYLLKTKLNIQHVDIASNASDAISILKDLKKKQRFKKKVETPDEQEKPDGTKKVHYSTYYGVPQHVFMKRRKLGDKTQPYNLIFMDIKMPGMSGLDCCKVIKDLELVDEKTCDVHLLTARGDVELERLRMMYSNSIQSIIEKPFSHKDLLQPVLRIKKKLGDLSKEVKDAIDTVLKNDDIFSYEDDIEGDLGSKLDNLPELKLPNNSTETEKLVEDGGAGQEEPVKNFVLQHYYTQLITYSKVCFIFLVFLYWFPPEITALILMIFIRILTLTATVVMVWFKRFYQGHKVAIKKDLRDNIVYYETVVNILLFPLTQLYLGPYSDIKFSLITALLPVMVFRGNNFGVMVVINMTYGMFLFLFFFGGWIYWESFSFSSATDSKFNRSLNVLIHVTMIFRYLRFPADYKSHTEEEMKDLNNVIKEMERDEKFSDDMMITISENVSSRIQYLLKVFNEIDIKRLMSKVPYLSDRDYDEIIELQKSTRRCILNIHQVTKELCMYFSFTRNKRLFEEGSSIPPSSREEEGGGGENKTSIPILNSLEQQQQQSHIHNSNFGTEIDGNFCLVYDLQKKLNELVLNYANLHKQGHVMLETKFSEESFPGLVCVMMYEYFDILLSSLLINAFENTDQDEVYVRTHCQPLPCDVSKYYDMSETKKKKEEEEEETEGEDEEIIDQNDTHFFFWKSDIGEEEEEKVIELRGKYYKFSVVIKFPYCEAIDHWVKENRENLRLSSLGDDYEEGDDIHLESPREDVQFDESLKKKITINDKFNQTSVIPTIPLAIDHVIAEKVGMFLAFDSSVEKGTKYVFDTIVFVPDGTGTQQQNQDLKVLLKKKGGGDRKKKNKLEMKDIAELNNKLWNDLGGNIIGEPKMKKREEEEDVGEIRRRITDYK